MIIPSNLNIFFLAPLPLKSTAPLLERQNVGYRYLFERASAHAARGACLVYSVGASSVAVIMKDHGGD